MIQTESRAWKLAAIPCRLIWSFKTERGYHSPIRGSDERRRASSQAAERCLGRTCGAAVFAAERPRTLRPRQTRIAQAAKRTEVIPTRTSNCEGGWVCFKGESMLTNKGKFARTGGDDVGLGDA